MYKILCDENVNKGLDKWSNGNNITNKTYRKTTANTLLYSIENKRSWKKQKEITKSANTTAQMCKGEKDRPESSRT
jgi:hypothetical protein